MKTLRDAINMIKSAIVDLQVQNVAARSSNKNALQKQFRLENDEALAIQYWHQYLVSL